MKKITAILVCLLLVASLAVTAFAATAEMTVTAAKTEIVRGETIEFTIAISEVANARGAGFSLVGSEGDLYDPAVFEFQGGKHLDTSAMFGAVQVTGGIPSGSLAYMSAVTMSGDIFTFSMKVKDDAPFGETTLTILPSAKDTVGAVDMTANTVTLKVVCPAHDNKEEVTKAATCSEAGEKTITCQICGETKTEAIAKLPHTEKTEVTKEATCSAEGEKVTTCEVCKEVLNTEKIAKLAHTEKTEVTKEATCSAEGEKVTTCEVCKEVLKTEKIAKLAHTLDAGVVTKEASCSAEGEKIFTCSVCKETEVEVIAKTEHTLDEGVITTPATTKKEGVKTHNCTVCKEVVTVAIPKLETPATGDNTMILPFVLLMVLSAAGVAVTVIGKKRAVR